MTDEPNILASKIAATPSDSSWSQAYNAGRLFAVISLSKPSDEEEKDILNKIGKETIESLEQEYYSLETKDLSAIKTAFEISLKKIPKDIEVSFCVSAVIKNVIYIFYFGSVRISIKRGEEFGVLVDSQDASETQAVSGKLNDNDIIFLQTKQFKELVPSNILIGSIDHQPPNEIAETIAPIIHREENGGAACVILQYKKAEEEPSAPLTLEKKEDENRSSSETEISKSNPKFSLFSITNFIKIPKIGKIAHTRKLILTVAVIIALLLTTLVFLSIKKQNDAKAQALFESIYAPAQTKYKEGQSLASLNKNLAQDSFRESSEILNNGKDKFPKDSQYEKQILDLLSKVKSEMESNSPAKIAQNSDRSKISLNIQNGSGTEGAAGKAADFLKEKGYNIKDTSNADKYGYKGVTIKVKNTESVYIDLLKKDLSEKYTVSGTSSDLPSDSPTDAIIIIGK